MPTILITILLLLPVVAGAEESPKCTSDNRGSCRIQIKSLINDEAGTLVSCNEALTQCWTPCEVKMREAMKLIDKDLQVQVPSEYREHVKGVNVFHSPTTLSLWHQTVHECVHETK